MQDQHILSRENTQWMQGAAALKIMLFHFLMQTEYYPRIFNVLSFTVTVFILISGFGLNESYKKNGLSGFWHKRFLRVIVPCWIVFLFRIPFAENPDIIQIVKNLLFTGSELWFMDFIIRWYIVYWVARKFFPKHTAAILLAYSIVTIFKEQFMSQQAFTFLLGYLASEHYDKIRKWNKAKVLKITICSVLYASAFTLLKSTPPAREIVGTTPFNLILLNIQFPFATMIIATPFLLPWVKKIPGIKWFGKVSYEIYIVHFTFMPYVTGLLSVFTYSAFSTAISAVFYKMNTMLKEKIKLVPTLAALLFIGICYILSLKYVMRATEHYGYICLTYAVVLALAYIVMTSHLSDKLKYGKTMFWTVFTVLIAAMLAVQYSFDPMENRVDRWSAIANPLAAMFKGEFPYLAETHLGGNASPFPVWMLFHIPFYALGNVGLSEIATAAIFVYSVKMAGGYKAGTLSAIMLALSINLWYETAVRSDLISNFLLLCAFINFLQAKRITFASHPYALSIAAGLWLSTRISTAFPLFILFFSHWLKLPIGKKVAAILLAISTFCITFLPLVIWDADSLFFAENNPFSLQARQGRPIDSILMAAIAVAMALNWHEDRSLMMLFSAVMLVLVPVIAYGHSMYIYGNWSDIFSSLYDITYLDAALPFLITVMATVKITQGRQKIPTCKA